MVCDWFLLVSGFLIPEFVVYLSESGIISWSVLV